jgi:CheY-like chemotaxis protein
MNDTSASSHYVNCAYCQSPFNAMTTMWCSCLVTERSLVCPSCLKCFCRAPASYQERFWSSAPPALLERKREEHARASSVLPVMPTPQGPVVRHPLVLVVDDEAAILRLAIRVIKGLGYGVLWADNGFDALALAKAHHPELVLTDAFMPRLDGRELCRQIKEDPGLRGIKVMVMTGIYTTAADVQQGRRQYGVDDYLAKPIDFVELGLLLKKHTDAVVAS